MPKHNPETLESVISHHRPNATNNIQIAPIPTGKFNDSYFVLADNEPLVLRIAPPRNAVFCFYEKDMMRQEPDIHLLLQKKTDVPVATIYAYNDSLTLINHDYMLMERLPGAPLTDVQGADHNHVLRQVGRHLAQTHALTAPTYGYIGAHHPMDPATTWVDAFEHMWNRLIDDIVSVGHYNGEESQFLRTLLDKHLPLFNHSVTSRLLHMDIWHQNILIPPDGSVTGIVDWDRALWGGPRN